MGCLTLSRPSIEPWIVCTCPGGRVAPSTDTIRNNNRRAIHVYRTRVRCHTHRTWRRLDQKWVSSQFEPSTACIVPTAYQWLHRDLPWAASVECVVKGGLAISGNLGNDLWATSDPQCSVPNPVFTPPLCLGGATLTLQLSFSRGEGVPPTHPL